MLQSSFTEQALNETAAVVATASASEGQKRRFVELLCFGTGGQKDRPLHDLCTTILMMARSSAALGLPQATGLEVMTRPAGELWAALSDAASVANSGLSITSQGRLRLEEAGEGLEMSRGRLTLIPLLADFLLSMDDFSFAAEWMDIASGLSALPPTVSHRDAVNAASRALYAYRRDHLNLYGARQVHTIITAFLDEHCEGRAMKAGDEHLIKLWEASDREGHVSFNALLAAVQTLREEEKDRASQRSSNRPIYLDQELGDGSGVTFGEILQEDQVAGIQDEDQLLEPQQVLADATEALIENPLPLVPKGQLRALTSWWRFQPVAGDLPLSVRRALGFAPVSNGLSNMRRTGKSKMTLEERLTCVEALSYVELSDELSAAQQGLDEAGREVLSYSDSPLAQAQISEFERAKRASDRSKSRAKGHKLPLSEQSALAQEATVPLAKLKSAIGTHINAQNRLAHPPKDLEAMFKEDTILFREVLTRIYGVQDDVD